MAYRADLTLPKQNVYTKEYQNRHEERTTRISSSSGRSTPISPSMENNPQLKLNEYLSLSHQLTRWLRDTIVELSKRDFPHTLSEMKDVIQQFERFRAFDVVKKSQERYLIANLFDDLQNTTRQLPIKAEQHINEVNKLWNEFVLALQEKDSAIHIEYARLQKLDNLVDKVQGECRRCRDLLDSMEAKVMAVKKWGHGSKSAMVNLKQLQSGVEDLFQLLYNDLKKLQQAGCQDLDQLAKTIQSLRTRYSNTRDILMSHLESGNSSDTSVPDETTTLMTKQLQSCFQWLREKEREMDKAGYGNDLRSSFNNFEAQKKLHQDIKEFQLSIQECINLKKNFPLEQHLLYNKQLSQLELLYIQLQSTSNFRLGNLRTLVSFLKDSSSELEWMKTKESEASDNMSSLDVASKEFDKFHNFGREVNAQSYKIESLLERGDNLIRDQHPASNTIQFFCNLLQVQRAWLIQLSKCVAIHIKNIKSYKEFHDELVEVDKWLTKQLHLVDGLSGKQDLNVDEAKKIIEAFEELRKAMQHYDDVIDAISHKSENISSIKMSSESFPPNIPIKALCSYKISNFSITEGERCILLSDSLSPKWKVRNSAGIDGILPSVCFIVCTPDTRINDFVSRLKKSYLELTGKLEFMLSRSYRCLMSHEIQRIKSLNAVMYQEMAPDERSRLRNNLHDSGKYLFNILDSDSSSYESLQREFKSCQQALDDFDQRAKTSYCKPNASVVILNDFGKLMQSIDAVEHIISLNSQISLYPFNEKVELAKKQLTDIEKSVSEIELNLESVKSKYLCMNISQRTATIEDMYNRLTEKFQNILHMQKTLSKRLELTAEFMTQKSEIEAFLIKIENSLLEIPRLSSKLSQVDEVRQKLQKLKNDFMKNSNALCNLEMKSKLLKQLTSRPQSAGVLLYSDGQNFSKDLSDIQSHWNALQQEILHRKPIVDQAHENLKTYKDEERAVDHILSDYENSFNLISQDLSLDLMKSTANLVSLLKNVKSFRFKMESLNKCTHLFLREAKAYENMSDQLSKSIERNIKYESIQMETLSEDMISLNDKYSILLESLNQNLSLRKPILDKLKCSYVLDSEKEFTFTKTFQPQMDIIHLSNAFEVPSTMEEHFQAENSWSSSDANRLNSAEGRSFQSGNRNQLQEYSIQNVSSTTKDDMAKSTPQEEHMHSEDVEEFFQPIKDGEEKITKHTKQEFHSRKTSSGFESISTHEKKLLSLVSTEALAYSGKIRFPLEVTRAIQYQLLIPKSGLFTHPETSEIMSLDDAIRRNFLTTNGAVFICPTSMKSYSLSDAFKMKLLDAHGCFSSLESVTNFDQLITNNFVRFKSDKEEPITESYKVKESVKLTHSSNPQGKVYFAISSVIDPSSKKLLDAFTGVQRGILDQANALYNGKDLSGNIVQIPIRDAIKLGLVFADESSCDNGFQANKLIKETKTFTLTGVLDPLSKKKLTLIEAVNSGYIDQAKGLFFDRAKKVSMPITEAISLGHVLAEVSISDVDNEGNDSSSKKIVTSKEVALTISSVVNPFNGNEISASDAIKMGIFDPSAGEYRNLKTRETISLNEAIDRKLIKVIQGRPRQTDLLREEKVASLHIDDEMDAREEMAHEEIVEERRTFQITGVKEPRSGKFISFNEAVACKLIDEEKGLYCDYITKLFFTIPEALERGFIIGTTQTFDQQELFKSAIVAHKKEDIIGVYNPIVDRMVSVNEALQLGLLNKDMTLYFDPKSNEVLKMDVAIQKGYVQSRVKSEGEKLGGEHDMLNESAITRDTKVTIDWSGGRVLNRATKEEISISKALEFGLIEDYVASVLRMKNPGKTKEEEDKEGSNSISLKVVVQVTYLKDESGRIVVEDEIHSTGEESIFLEESQEIYSGMSFHDAVILGLYDIRKGMYYDPFSKRSLTLRESIEIGCIHPLQPALIDISNGKTFPLTALIEDGIINLLDGVISLSRLLGLSVTLDPNFLNFLSHTINLEDALRCGLFDDNTGLFQHPFSGRTYDMEAALKNNLISSEASVVLNPLTGDRLLLRKAVEENVIDGKSGRFTDSTLEKNITLSRAIILGLIKQRYQCKCSSIMDLQTGETCSLEECIDIELVDQHVPCVYDPSSKSRISISTAVSEGLVNKTKKNFFDKINRTEMSLSDAAKIGLIQFPGAPVLSNTNCISDDVTQSSLQTNVSLLKGARLLENITDSFSDIPSMGTRDFSALGKIQESTEASSEVNFLKNEPDKKVFETKTFDKSTDENPISVIIAKDGSLIATQRVVDKVQKSQVKETLESINGDGDLLKSFSPDMVSASKKNAAPQKFPGSDYEEFTQTFPNKAPDDYKSIMEVESHTRNPKTACKPEDFILESGAGKIKKTYTPSAFQPITSSSSLSHKMMFEPFVKEDKLSSSSKEELINIDWKNGNVIHISENRMMTSVEAFERGFISLDTKEILDKIANKTQVSGHKQITLNDALDRGLLNVPLSKVRNLSTNENLTIEEAVAVSYIDLDRSVIIDPLDMKPRSLSELVECNIFNIENAVMKNSVSGKIMTLSDISQFELIPRKGLPDISDVKVMSFNEALDKGLLDENTNKFTESNSGLVINLETALRIGYLKHDPTEKCSSGIKKHRYPTPLTLLEAFKSGILSFETFLYTNPYSGEKLTFGDAISKGLILVPELDGSSDVEGIDFETAYKQRYVDVLNNIFIDPITSVLMPLDAAIKKGYVILPRNNLGQIEVDDEVQSRRSSAITSTRYLGFSDLPLEFGDALMCGLYDEVIGTFSDPYESGPLTLEEALQYNLIKDSSKIKDPVNGKWISLLEGIRNGHVDPITGKFIDPLTLSLIALKEAEELEMFHTAGPCLWIGKFQNSDQFSGTISLRIVQVFDPINKCWISPEDGIKSGYLSLYNNVYVDPTSNMKNNLFDAMNNNKIKVEIFDAKTAQILERTYIIKSVIDPLSKQEISPNIADQKKILDMINKTYYNFYNRTRVSLHEAYLLGLIKACRADSSNNQQLKIENIKEVMDHTTGEKMTLSQAVDNKLIDNTMSYYIDPRNGQKFNLFQAWQQGYLFLKSDNLHGIKSKMIKSVIDPRTGEEIPISDAIRHKIVDKQGNKFWNMKTNTYMDLDYAIAKNLVLIESAERATKKPAIIEIEDHLNSGAKVYVIKSVRDPSSAKEFDPVEAERRGYLNKVQGVYMNPLTGKQMSIKQAIDQGFIHASLVEDPDYDVLKKNEDAYAVLESPSEITSVVDPITNEKISLFEGVRRGFLNLNHEMTSSQTKSFMPVMDPSSRNLSLSSLSQSSNLHDSDDDYSFTMIEPFFFTVPRSFLDGRLAESTQAEQMTTRNDHSGDLIDQDKELSFDPISSQAMSILEGLNSSKLPGSTNDVQFETFIKKSKCDVTKSFENKLMRVDAKYIDPQLNHYVDERNSYVGNSLWKDMAFAPNLPMKNRHSLSNDERSTVSKEDLQSLDQLLAELEQVKGDDVGLHNHLRVDDTSFMQPNSKQEKSTSDRAFYSFESDGFSSLASSKQATKSFADRKAGSKNETLNDSLSDFMAEDLNEKFIVREDDHLESINIDLEKTSSVGRPASIASASDYGREQELFTLDELVGQNLYDRTSGMVCNPETGRKFSLLEAIERGIVQKNSVRLCDPASGKLITLTEAFERGIMDPENGNVTDIETGKVSEFSESVNKALDMKCSSLQIPVDRSKRESLALCSALEKNYFDSQLRRFKFPGISKIFTLKEAIDEGLIRTRSTAIKDLDSGQKTFFDTVIALGLVDLERGLFKDTRGCFLSIEKAYQENILVDCEISPRPYSLHVLLEDGLYSKDSDSFFDPDSKQFVSLKDAINKNLLDPKSVLCIDSSSNEIVSLEEAVARNFIGSDGKRNTMSLSVALDKGVALERPIALSKAIDIGLMNETTGKFLDPIFRRFFTLKEALENGFISKESKIADPSTRNVIPLSRAISSGIVNPIAGTVINTYTNDSSSLKEAYASAKLPKKKLTTDSDGSKTPVEVVEIISDGTQMTSEAGSKIPEDANQIDMNVATISQTNEFLRKYLKRDINLEEAVKRGLIDQNSCLIVLPWSNEIPSLKNVIDTKLFDLKTCVLKKPNTEESFPFPSVVLKESIDCNVNNFSLAEALNLGMFNPDTGIVTDPNTERKMSFFESLKSNLISYQKTVVMTDGKITNLLEAVSNGLVDEVRGAVKDLQSNRTINFFDALKRSLVLDAYIPPKFSFEQMAKAGLYDSSSKSFVNPFNKNHIGIEECLGLDLLDANKCNVFLPDSKKHLPLTHAFNLKLLSSDLNLIMDPLSKKQYPITEALDGSLELKYTKKHVMKDDEAKNLEPFIQKLEVYRDWISEAYQQLGIFQITANKDDLGRELRRLQNFSVMVHEIKPDVALIYNQMEKACEDEAHHFDKTKFEKLKILNHGVKSQFNLLLENVKNQIKLLTSCHEELTKYEDEKRKFETWLITATDDINLKFSNFKHIREVTSQKEALKNYVDEIFIRQGDLKYVEICKNQFLDQARHFDALQYKSKNLKRSSSHLDLLYSMIDDLKHLTNEYNALRSNSRIHLDRIEALNDCLKRVEDIDRQIKASLDEIELSAGYLYEQGDKNKSKAEIEKQLKTYLSEMQSQYLFFEKLKKIVDDLIKQLSQFGSSDQLQKEISDKVNHLESYIKRVDEVLNAKNMEIEYFSCDSQLVSDEVKELSSLVGSAECLVEEMDRKKVMLDEDLVAGRIKEMKTLRQEISSLQQPLSNLMQTGPSGTMIKQLHKRYRDVISKFSRKENGLERVFEFVSKFNSNMRNLKLWMNDLLGRLEVKGVSSEELKVIHTDILDRSEEFMTMKGSHEDYLGKLEEAVAGKEKLNEMIEDTQMGLAEIEDLCLVRISQEEKKEELETTFKRLKDKIECWITGKENFLNSDQSRTLDNLKPITENIEDFHSFKDYIDELNDTCLIICELLSDCDRVSSSYQRLKRCFRKGLRSPSPISFTMKHFDFEETLGEHQRTAMELTSRYEIVGERLENKKKELQENLELLEELERDCRNLSSWLEKIEETFRTHSTSLPSPEEITKIENCQMQILKNESRINSLKSRLKQLPQSLDSWSSVSETIDHLAKRWEIVQGSSAEVLELCNERASDVSLFRSLQLQLGSWLSMKEKVIAKCLGTLGIECDVLENQSIQVELLKEEMKSEQENFELFVEKGHKIVDQSGSEEMYACIEEIRTRWYKVQNKLAEKDSAISQLLAKCIPFYEDMNVLTETCSESTKLFSDLHFSNSDVKPFKDLKDKIESYDKHQVHLKNMLERLKQSASDLCDLTNDSNLHSKIQSRIILAEKSYKDYLKYLDLVQKHLASKKDSETKALSDMKDLMTWMDGILRHLTIMEEESMEPSVTLSLNQVFQNLKEKFKSKKTNIEDSIRTLEELSKSADCEEFHSRLAGLCLKFMEVKEKFESLEPKVKLISEKANQCIADVDKLSLWLELTNTKFLFSGLVFNSDNLPSKLDEALHLKSEFDAYSVDLELIRNYINELNCLSPGTGSNMEQILLGLENVWNVSRTENENRLKILEESQDKLDEFNDIEVQINTYLASRENTVTHQSTQSEGNNEDSQLEKSISQLQEILTFLSAGGFMDIDELKSMEANVAKMIKRKCGIQEKLIEVKKKREFALSSMEELLREIGVIKEDQDILEDCIKMNTKNNLDLSKLKQLSGYLEIFKKQNEAIESKIMVLEKDAAELISAGFMTDSDHVQEKVKDLRDHSSKIFSQLEEHMFVVESSTTKIENLESQISEVIKLIAQTSEKINSFDKSPLSLEQKQDNLKTLREITLNKIQISMEEIRREGQNLSNLSVISISETSLNSKTEKLDNLWMTLTKNLSMEEHKLQSALLEQGNFVQALKVQSSQLLAIEGQLNSSKINQLELSSVNKQLEIIKEAHENLNSWHEGFEQVKDMADQLNSQLNEGQRKNLLLQVNDLQNRWTDLSENTKEKMGTLNESLELLTDYQQKWNSLQSHLQIIEEKLQVDVELTDMDSNDILHQELQSLSEEVELYVLHVEDLYDLSTKISKKIQSNDVADSLNKNMSDLTARLEDISTKLHLVKEKVSRGIGLMKEFTKVHLQLSSSFDNLETHQSESELEDCEEMLAAHEPRVKRQRDLYFQLREFLSAKIAHEYSEIMTDDQARCETILSQARSRNEMYKVKKSETKKLQKEVDELLESVDKLKKLLKSPQKFNLSPQNLKEQLARQKALHEDVLLLKGRSRKIVSTLRRQSRIFEIEPSLDEGIIMLAGEVESCFKMSTFKIHVLEQAHPLALQLHETSTELNRLLNEYVISFRSMDESLSNHKPIRQQQEDLKTLRQKVMDQRFLLDRLYKTALLLSRLFEKENRDEIEKIVHDIDEKFKDIKTSCQNKINHLEQSFYESSQLSEKIDDLLDFIESTKAEIDVMDLVPCQPEKILEYIEDISAIEGNMEGKKENVELLQASSFNLSDQIQPESFSSAHETRDLTEESKSLANVYYSILEEVLKRKKHLEKVQKYSLRFWNLYHVMSSGMKQLEEHLYQHNNIFNEIPPSNMESLMEHSTAIQEAEERVEDLFHRMSDLQNAGSELEKLVDETGGKEIVTCLDNLQHQLTNLKQLQALLCSDVNSQMEDLLSLKSRFKDNVACFMDSEQQLNDFCESSFNAALAEQFLRNLYEKSFSKLHETHALKIWIKNLMRKRRLTVESHLSAQINELKSKWLQLIDRISKRIDDHMQRVMSNYSCNLDNLLEDLYKWSDGKNEKMKGLPKPIHGCSSQLSFLQIQLQMLDADLKNHQTIFRMVENAVNSRFSGKDHKRMSLRLVTVKSNIEGCLSKVEEKSVEVERLLAEAKELDENLDVMSEELDRINDVVKNHLMSYHLKPSLLNQQQSFEAQKKLFDEIQPRLRGVISSLECELKFSKDPNANSLKETINSLNSKIKHVERNMEKWIKKLDETNEKCQLFEKQHDLLVQWLTDFEKNLEVFSPIRTTNDGCHSKIPLLQAYKKELNERKTDLKKLEELVIMLKHLGDKTEPSIIKQMMERVGQSFRNCRLEVARLLSSYNKSSKAANLLETNITFFIKDLHALEQKLLDYQVRSPQNDVEEIRNQMREHQEIQQQLNRKQSDYDLIMDSLKSILDKSSPQDQQLHNEKLSAVKKCWNNVCQKSLEWQHSLEDSLLRRSELRERVETLIEWLSKAEPELSNQQNLCGNLDFVTELEEEHNVFLEELSLWTAAMNSVEDFYKNTLLTSEICNDDNNNAEKQCSDSQDDNVIRAKILELKYKWNIVNSLAATKSEQIRLALEKATMFDKEAEEMMTWLEAVEESIGSLSHSISIIDNEETLKKHLQQIEDIEKSISEVKPKAEKFLWLSNEILMQAHPDVLQDLTLWVKNFQNKFDDLSEQTLRFRLNLMNSFEDLRRAEEELEVLISWLKETEKKLKADDELPVVENLPIVEQLFQDFELLEAEIQGKQSIFDKLMRNGRVHGGSSSSKRKDGRHMPEKRFKNERMVMLNDKWKQVWVLMMDRRRKLQDAIDKLNKMEQLKNFDPEEWMEKFFKWMNNNQSRVINLFKKCDRKLSGNIKKKDFVEAVLSSNFPTTAIEAEIVADLFAEGGLIDYKQFASNVQGTILEESETAKIKNEIERAYHNCLCQKKYPIVKQSDTKYKFGMSEKLRLVRIQRSCIMVRVGGGWVTLEEFLLKNDPCRVKRKVSSDCKEQFVLAEGVDQAMSPFKPKSHLEYSHRHVSSSDLTQSSKATQHLLTKGSRSASSTPDPEFQTTQETKKKLQF